jgi:hypothetical protein
MSKEIELGDVFESKEALKEALHQYAVFNHFEFATQKSNKTSLIIVCKEGSCPWRLYASTIQESSHFAIRTFANTHTCFGLNSLGNRQASASFIASVIKQKVQQAPELKPCQIVRDLQTEIGLEINYHKAYKAKDQARAKINGSEEAGYRALPQYCTDLEVTNPGSVISFCTIPNDNRFHRIFISLAASIFGFSHCRPLLGLDGCHIKTKYQGVILTATAVDAMGCLFPYAYAVVDIENNDNWLWFLQNLRRSIQLSNPALLTTPKALTILSDRQKGLIEGIRTILPLSAHGYCVRHLEQNFLKAFGNNRELRTLLWTAAKATTEETFKGAFESMKTIDSQTVEWLEKNAPAEFWAELFFKGHRYGHYTSNIAESLNAWLLKARELPILPLLETIRQQLMDWFTKRRELESNTQGKLVSHVTKKIQASLHDRASRYRYHRSNEDVFEILSGVTMAEYIVNLQNKSCSCREWKASGIPCAHALRCIVGTGQDPQDFAAPFYRLDNYRDTYAGVIMHPRFDDFSEAIEVDENTYLKRKRNISEEGEGSEENEEDLGVLPPRTRRKAGRPGRLEKNRKKAALERVSRRVTRCSICHQEGHTKRKCRNGAGS